MSTIQIVLAFLALAWITQLLASWFQWQHLQSTVRHAVRTHADGFLGVGKSRSRFGFGTIVMLVAGPDQRVRDLQVMAGMSVLARFKTRDEFRGLSLDMLQARQMNQQMALAIKEAIGQISKAS